LVLAAADGGVSALDGTWVLDLERSTDPGPVLQRLDVPWVLRKVGPSVRVTNVIVTSSEKAVIEAKSTLIPSKRTTQVFDGVTETKDDFFGHPFSYVVTIEGDTIVAKGAVTLPKEGKVPLELRRRVDEEGRMIYRIIVTPPGEKTLEIVRVFNRK
jgi:hypothetical protein